MAIPPIRQDELPIPGSAGPEAGPKSQEQHSATPITAQGLHGGIVQELNGFSKGAFVIVP